jgi:two-component system, NtrC family, response regulator HydG
MQIAHYWETIVNTLQDGLIVVDPGGRILFLNPAAEKLTGYSATDLVGNSCRMLNCTGCRIIGRGIAEKWCALYATGDVKAKRCLITNLDGRAVHVVKNGSVLRDESGRIIGAVETLTDMSEIVRQQQEIENLRKSCLLGDGFLGLVGVSPAMQQVYELIDNVAQTEAPVMIQGQSGTGKELVARAIHESGPRCDKPFIKVNCAALNENLLESELFGHVKGAYTGADRHRMGRFEAANEGTIFLDEVGDIPPPLQVKLLRVLEEKEIERVGDHRPIGVDVRIVTATNRDLEVLTARGSFRADLFFRISVFPLQCPSLSERLEDIPLLAQHFIRHNVLKSGKKIEGMSPAAMAALTNYAWPGNVRELRSAIEYAFVLCKDATIECGHLPPKISHPRHASAQRDTQDNRTTLKEREDLVRVLRQAAGNQSQAARILGVSRVTIWKRMRKYGIKTAGAE